jgi:hypothetical protein
VNSRFAVVVFFASFMLSVATLIANHVMQGRLLKRASASRVISEDQGASPKSPISSGNEYLWSHGRRLTSTECFLTSIFE